MQGVGAEHGGWVHWLGVLVGCAASRPRARGHSAIVGMNCVIVGGANGGIVVIIGVVGLVVMFQGGKWVAVVCGPLMYKMQAPYVRA